MGSGRLVHLQFGLDDLIRRSDGELAEMVQGGTPLEMRAQLVIQRAKGQRYLVVGECDRRGDDGGCLGHPLPEAGR